MLSPFCPRVRTHTQARNRVRAHTHSLTSAISSSARCNGEVGSEQRPAWADSFPVNSRRVPSAPSRFGSLVDLTPTPRSSTRRARAALPTTPSCWLVAPRRDLSALPREARAQGVVPVQVRAAAREVVRTRTEKTARASEVPRVVAMLRAPANSGAANGRGSPRHSLVLGHWGGGREGGRERGGGSQQNPLLPTLKVTQGLLHSDIVPHLPHCLLDRTVDLLGRGMIVSRRVHRVNP